MDLKENQSALLLEIGESGEVEVNVASGDQYGITATLCKAIAYKLTHDEVFQAELMEMVETDGV